MTGHTSAEFLLAAVVDSSFDAIVSKDLNSIITSWNAAAERMFGYTPEEAIGQSVLILIPPHLRSEETDIIERVKRGERLESYETIRVRKDGRIINVSLTISPIVDAEGTILGASKIARDITTAKENERRIQLLLKEINHRVKNQFAVILAMIRETRSRARNVAEFEAQLRERIMAMSRSQDLLVTSQWSGAGLFDLVTEHLKAFGVEERVTLSGPAINLRPQAVQTLGMAIHELGTNAAKYGAFGENPGSVEVSWRLLTDDEGAQQIELVWDEQMTHLAKHTRRSKRRGFGSVVLERAVPASFNGVASLARDPGRVRWVLTAPYSALAGDDSDASTSDKVT